LLKKRILFCNCSFSKIIPDEKKENVFNEISKMDCEIFHVDDLCELALNHKDKLKEIADYNNFTIIACYPRYIKNLFDKAGIDFTDDKKIINQRILSENEIIKMIDNPDSNQNAHVVKIKKEIDWTPWFPVIDYDRCTNCKQCLNFCLFGVYSNDENDKVKVVNPQNCKNNCPACARICPSIAIIFPKYGESPINGGEITDEKSEKERIKVDVDKILGDDVYKALAERREKAKKIKLLKDNVL